ncbi:hypothetical protein ACQUW5_04485 [Legionella sp. CNM-1927-20]|uniref:hypothetical protein n=1 Tax=Legionella sp. CNM-1927-20 TaxID=3422221 RepID=UPI00403AE179
MEIVEDVSSFEKNQTEQHVDDYFTRSNELAVPNDNLISTNHTNLNSPYSPAFFAHDNDRRVLNQVGEQPALEKQNHDGKLFSILEHELFHARSEPFNGLEDSHKIRQIAQEFKTTASSASNKKRKRLDQVSEQPILEEQNHDEQLFSELENELNKHTESFNSLEDRHHISQIEQELKSSSSNLAPFSFFQLGEEQAEEMGEFEEIYVRDSKKSRQK